MSRRDKHVPMFETAKSLQAGFALTVVLAATACASSRYVGSVGRDGTYVNRGYGLALRMRHAGLAVRWKLVNPNKLPARPEPDLPVPSREPIDLDGDGMLSVGESILHFEPTVRLLSRTSTGARADVRVEILSGPAEDVPLDRLLGRALKLWTKTPQPVRQRAFQRSIHRRLQGWSARVTTATTARERHHLAVIEQGPIVAEERIRRRQLVTVHVYAPDPAAETIDEDFEAILDALILSRTAARESVLERW